MSTIPELTRDEFKMLTKRKEWRGVLGALRVYALIIVIIAATMAAINVYGWWWVTILAVPLIGALQHALSILLHEAVHSLFFKNKKLNDFVGNILFGYPIGFSLDYRSVHFPHHTFLGTDDDPDMVNYRDFPAPRTRLIKKILTDFSGIGAVLQFLNFTPSENTATKKPSGKKAHLLGIVLTQLFIFALFILSGFWWLYFFLWIGPLVTVAKGLAQLRNLAEHLLRTNAPDGAERIRTFTSNRVERFFIGPLNFNYHAEHHWYPMIPYYNLPKARAILRDRPGYREEAEWCGSYLGVIRQAVIV